jgi:hypothetical protein
MTNRTLVTHRRYFGIDPVKLRAAAARVLTRVAGLPHDRARVRAVHLRHDFGMNTLEGQALVDELVAEGFLRPGSPTRGDYRLTRRFTELASARIVDPLPRARARLLLAQACECAARINAEWSRNPLEIEMIAPFGSYMSREAQLAELSLGIVVRARPASRRARWRMATKAEGANQIRTTFRELSSFIRVRVVNDAQLLPRPFAVAFHAEPTS